jgi:hypothetical protein
MEDGKPRVERMVRLAPGPMNRHSVQPSGQSARVVPKPCDGKVVYTTAFSG